MTFPYSENDNNESHSISMHDVICKLGLAQFRSVIHIHVTNLIDKLFSLQTNNVTIVVALITTGNQVHSSCSTVGYILLSTD